MEQPFASKKTKTFFIVSVLILITLFSVIAVVLKEFDITAAISILIAGCLLSASLTTLYYWSILFVGWIRRTGGKMREEQIKHILTGALLFNMMPLFAPLFWISGLWFLIGLYSWPVTLVENVFNVKVSHFLFLTIPLWTLIGGSFGYLMFRLRIATKPGSV